MSKTYKIKCFDKISACGLKQLDDAYTFTENFSEADAALVRSSSLHETEAENSLLAVARAEPESITFPSKSFLTGALSYSIRRAQTQTGSRNSSSPRCCFPAGISSRESIGPRLLKEIFRKPSKRAKKPSQERKSQGKNWG